MNKDTKMVIVVRGDLKNTKGEKVRSGKIVAQACHAALGFVWANVKGKKVSFEMTDAQFEWYTSGQTKITLKAKDEKELVEIYQKAIKAGIAAELIVDAGRTEFDGPTKTCVAIGPDYSDKINKVTGSLGLY